MQLRFLERWISIVRLIALPFIVGAIAVADYPPGRWETWAWITTAASRSARPAVLARSTSEPGGTLEVSSDARRRATFTLELPARR